MNESTVREEQKKLTAWRVTIAFTQGLNLGGSDLSPAHWVVKCETTDGQAYLTACPTYEGAIAYASTLEGEYIMGGFIET